MQSRKFQNNFQFTKSLTILKGLGSVLLVKLETILVEGKKKIHEHGANDDDRLGKELQGKKNNKEQYNSMLFKDYV